jgi:DNA-binding MarR family transcriptional regulator
LAPSDEREQLITTILGIQQDLGRAFAYDRSAPILATTLTMQQLKVMIILSFHDDIAGHELAEHLGVKLGTVTGIVDRLVAQDMVSRNEDPADRRVRRVTLTTRGRRLVDELSDTGLSRFRRLLDHLDTETLRSFEAIMDQLRMAGEQLATE